MLVAHRNGMAVWTNPYVTDGLIAMWDGEWNAGGGVHDPNATVWTDLGGNGYNFEIPSSGASFADDCVTLNNSSLSTSLQEVARPEFTIECVAESYGGTGAWLWLKNPAWVGGSLVGWLSNGRCYFPWYEIGNLGGQGLAYAGLVWAGSNQVLYKDANAIASTARSIDSRNVLSSIYIGEYNGEKKTTMNCHCVRLYSRALASEEISANYAIDKARFNLS